MARALIVAALLCGNPSSTAISGISARNGSWIDDTTTLNIRKAGSWTAL